MEDVSPREDGQRVQDEKVSFNAYVRNQLRAIQEKNNLSNATMAKLIGCERSAWYRWINNTSDIGLDTLEKICSTFGYPPEFWLPPMNGITPREITAPVQPDCVCAGQAPLTKQIVQAIGRLSGVEKHQLLALVGNETQHLSLLVQLYNLIAPLEEDQRARLVSAIAAIVVKKKQPVPP